MLKSFYIVLLFIILNTQAWAYVPFGITSGADKQRVEMVDVAGYGNPPCTVTPCTIFQQTGTWVTSVTRNSIGNYTVNFASNIFSAKPICVTQVDTVGGGGYGSGATDGSSTHVNVQVANNGSYVDQGFSMVCMGTRP